MHCFRKYFSSQNMLKVSFGELKSPIHTKYSNISSISTNFFIKYFRCTLDSFILTEKIDDSVIEIESGNEDEVMDDEKSITTWYTNILKSLERRYPSTFEAIVKEIIRSDNKSMSELKKRSLKKVLSFLFTVVCADDNVNLFEKLYHYNAQQRVEAIKFLVNNLSKMSFSDDSKSLLKGSIAENLAMNRHWW